MRRESSRWFEACALALAASVVLWGCGGDDAGPGDGSHDAGGGSAAHAGASGGSGGGAHAGSGGGAGSSGSGGAGGKGGSGGASAGSGGKGDDRDAGSDAGGSHSASDAGDDPQGDAGTHHGQDIVDILGDTAATARKSGSNGADLWTNLYAVDETCELVSFEQYVKPVQAFKGYFVVFESETRAGDYTNIYEQAIDVSAGGAAYQASGAIDGVTLEAGRFYAIGMRVGEFGFGMQYAEAPLSTGDAAHAVSFGEQFGAAVPFTVGLDAPPMTFAVVLADDEGRTFAQRVTTR